MLIGSNRANALRQEGGRSERLRQLRLRLASARKQRQKASGEALARRKALRKEEQQEEAKGRRKREEKSRALDAWRGFLHSFSLTSSCWLGSILGFIVIVILALSCYHVITILGYCYFIAKEKMQGELLGLAAPMEV